MCIMAGIATENHDPQKRRKSDKKRLDSWKSIGNYLNRSVRTVRRWESTEDLPVHRHRHKKGFSVYAYQAELDAWQLAHQDSLSNALIGFSESSDSRGIRRWMHLAPALIIALLVGGLVDRYMIFSGSATEDVLSLPQLDDSNYWPQSSAQVLVAPVFSAWSDGRIHEALSESRSVARRLPDLPVEIQAYVTNYLVDFLLSLGRISDARELVAGIPDGDTRHAMDAYIMFAAGDKARIREVLEAESNNHDPSNAEKNVILAMAALMDSNVAEAKLRLLSATGELAVEDQKIYFIALDMLSAVLKNEGNLSDAIIVLERTMPMRDAAAHNRSGFFWLMCQRNLANLYRESGREIEAVHIEGILRDWLELADETFPLALSLVEA
jgi:hypothetical protein